MVDQLAIWCLVRPQPIQDSFLSWQTPVHGDDMGRRSSIKHYSLFFKKVLLDLAASLILYTDLSAFYSQAGTQNKAGYEQAEYHQ